MKNLLISIINSKIEEQNLINLGEKFDKVWKISLTKYHPFNKNTQFNCLFYITRKELISSSWKKYSDRESGFNSEDDLGSNKDPDPSRQNIPDT